MRSPSSPSKGWCSSDLEKAGLRVLVWPMRSAMRPPLPEAVALPGSCAEGCHDPLLVLLHELLPPGATWAWELRIARMQEAALKGRGAKLCLSQHPYDFDDDTVMNW
jgi:hypothetical protein